MRESALSETNYSFIERKLHYLALGLESVAEMSFALEKALWRPSESNVSEKPHVFMLACPKLKAIKIDHFAVSIF